MYVANVQNKLYNMFYGCLEIVKVTLLVQGDSYDDILMDCSWIVHLNKEACCCDVLPGGCECCRRSTWISC